MLVRFRSEHRKVLIFSQFKKVTFISSCSLIVLYCCDPYRTTCGGLPADIRFWTLFMTILFIGIGLITVWMVVHCPIVLLFIAFSFCVEYNNPCSCRNCLTFKVQLHLRIDSHSLIALIMQNVSVSWILHL